MASPTTTVPSNLDWSFDKAVVLVALPGATLRGTFRRRPVLYFVSYGPIFLCDNVDTPAEAWKLARQYPAVQAFERKHNPTFALPVQPPAAEESEVLKSFVFRVRLRNAEGGCAWCRVPCKVGIRCEVAGVEVRVCSAVCWSIIQHLAQHLSASPAQQAPREPTAEDRRRAFEARQRADELNPDRKYLLLVVEDQALALIVQERQLRSALGTIAALAADVEVWRKAGAKQLALAEAAEAKLASLESRAGEGWVSVGRFDKALNLLRRVDGDSPAPDKDWWREVFELTGEHMILTEEGWEPGEVKQSHLDDHDGDHDSILDEVNAPPTKPSPTLFTAPGTSLAAGVTTGNATELSLDAPDGELAGNQYQPRVAPEDVDHLVPLDEAAASCEVASEYCSREGNSSSLRPLPTLPHTRPASPAGEDDHATA